MLRGQRHIRSFGFGAFGAELRGVSLRLFRWPEIGLVSDRKGGRPTSAKKTAGGVEEAQAGLRVIYRLELSHLPGVDTAFGGQSPAGPRHDACCRPCAP